MTPPTQQAPKGRKMGKFQQEHKEKYEKIQQKIKHLIEKEKEEKEKEDLRKVAEQERVKQEEEDKRKQLQEELKRLQEEKERKQQEEQYHFIATAQARTVSSHPSVKECRPQKQSNQQHPAILTRKILL